jgi:putative heme-binding domain-containing protein
MNSRWIFLVISACLFLADHALFAQDAQAPASLERQLLAEKADVLAREALAAGDPVRGAILFHQPYLTCTKCHSAGEEIPHPLGPDLARLDGATTPAHLVESILEPSKAIHKGYEPVTVQLIDGTTISGVLIEKKDGGIVLRDVAQEGKSVMISKEQIDEVAFPKTSLMPAGLVNMLAGRQQFLDLAAYLSEIAAKGPARALELKPAAALYALPPIPEYEQHLDHAGLIGSLDDESLKRGEALYKRVCANCHGTHDQPGSLPTSLRFATGKFKHGSDPYALYQTLTRGFGMMVPQSWMVPEQKYDVVHYIREKYLKRDNPSQYIRADKAYLARLPRGDTRGPAPSKIEPWIAMDYGPNLINTYEIGQDSSNFAYKGIAMRLDPGPGGVSRGKNWMVFDHDTLRVAAAWSARAGSTDPAFIDWQGIHFDGQHNIHPHISGAVAFANPSGPGWANPETGRFDDPRPLGRDGRPYGPLPRAWAHYRGLYAYGPQNVISYTVGTTSILELASVATTAGDEPQLTVFSRTFQIGPRSRNLNLAVATDPARAATLLSLPIADGKQTSEVAVFGPLAIETVVNGKPETDALLAGLQPAVPGANWTAGPTGRLMLTIPSGKEPLAFTLWQTRCASPPAATAARVIARPIQPSFDLSKLTHGGPRRWPEVVSTHPILGNSANPYAVDVLTHPANNPWVAQMRFTGLDFFDDGDSAAVCDWDGDVWLVRGMAKLGPNADQEKPTLTWQRIASGLFQPLGLKIVDGKVHVTCRDQLVILHDLNGDGETDFYENFNNDHQVTEHFHEFAMGLQVDGEGNFYYAKSARHALPALVPQHGTLLRISSDGLRTDILANGFRAANGVCLNSDGSFIVTDQEGHWNPKNRINRVKPGGFYGNMFGFHDVTDASDSAMEQPVCWITNKFDRSPAELLWVTSDRFGPLEGSLLNLSYGYGKIYVVPHENVDGQWQGGMCELPLAPFPTGIMRGRFSPHDGQLYVCGMYSWAGSATAPGGLYRVRYTGRAVYVPVAVHARKQALDISLSGTLDRKTVGQVERYAVKVWGLKRTANYGSEHYNEHSLKVTGASLSEGGRTIRLEIPDLAATWCMEIKYSLKSADGTPVTGTIHNTIHRIAEK